MAALDYFDAGLGVPIPCVVDPVTRLKKPITPKGWAPGRDNPYPDRARVEEWVRRYRGAHIMIGLRPYRTVLGLDADLYDGKRGRESLALLIGRFGDLPPTWISTSRFDGSGIRLFRVDDNDPFHDPAPGIEVVRWCHRFVTVAPSRHYREGRPPYQWYGPDRKLARDYIPSLDDLPVLPAPWVVGLSGASAGARDRVTTSQAATGWLAGRDEPCATVAATLAGYLRAVKAAGRNGGAYGEALRGAHALIGDAETGHRGAPEAVRRLRTAYVAALAARPPGQGRGKEEAEREFNRHLSDEVSRRRIPQPGKASGCTACREAEALDGVRARRG